MRLTAWFVVNALADFCWTVPNFGPKRYSNTVTPPPYSKVPFIMTMNRRILSSIVKSPLATRSTTTSNFWHLSNSCRLMRSCDSIYTNSTVMSSKQVYKPSNRKLTGSQMFGSALKWTTRDRTSSPHWMDDFVLYYNSNGTTHCYCT